MLLLVACRACEPQLPSTNNEEQKEDTSKDESPPVDSPQDSKEDSEPAPFCDLMETEPNDTLDTPMSMPMGQWICGLVDHFADADFYSITPTEPGWITIEVDAASRGSSADMDLTVTDGDRSVIVYTSYLSTDPKISFPADTVDTYIGWVSEHSQLLYGEDYKWYLRAYVDKAPLGWSMEEVEPNGIDTPQELPMEERVYGTISSSEDQDWYHVRTPDTASALILDIDANEYGSPMNATMVIRSANIAEQDYIIKWREVGEIDYNPDPHWEMKVEGPMDLYLQIFDTNEAASRFHWYTLSVKAEYDTGSP
jgi:hypothetical protein